MLQKSVIYTTFSFNDLGGTPTFSLYLYLTVPQNIMFNRKKKRYSHHRSHTVIILLHSAQVSDSAAIGTLEH